MVDKTFAIIVSGCVLLILLLVALLLLISWKKNRASKEESFLTFLSRPFKESGCLAKLQSFKSCKSCKSCKSKVPNDAQLLVETNSVASSIHNYNFINENLTHGPPKQGKYEFTLCIFLHIYYQFLQYFVL